MQHVCCFWHCDILTPWWLSVGFCPNNVTPIGSCVNGLCPVGFTCFNGACCQTTAAPTTSQWLGPVVFLVERNTALLKQLETIRRMRPLRIDHLLVMHWSKITQTWRFFLFLILRFLRSVLIRPLTSTAFREAVYFIINNHWRYESAPRIRLLSAACPNGQASPGQCVNGLCPTGLTCVGTACCPTTATSVLFAILIQYCSSITIL